MTQQLQRLATLAVGKGARAALFSRYLSAWREIDRCDAEIAEILARDNSATPAYLSTLGVADWEREKRLIVAEFSRPQAAQGAVQ